MRYFKYKKQNLTYKYALKEFYASLDPNEKRIFRREKLLPVISFILFFLFFGIGGALMALIPKPSFWLLAILYFVAIVIIGIALLIICFLLTNAITQPLWNKVKLNPPQIKRSIFQRSCAHLREFYNLKEPYIITKCYESTDKSFEKRDVCVFIANDELRVTADIVHGFLYGYKDLGCYCFKPDEIKLSKICKDKLLILELKCENTVFYLGYRAKSYIEKNFPYLKESKK